MAKPKILIDNDKVKVTEWLFEVGDSTGHHVHENNYIVVPMLDGELKILENDCKNTLSLEIILKQRKTSCLIIVLLKQKISSDLNILVGEMAGNGILD